jgi:hypothetical protein
VEKGNGKQQRGFSFAVPAGYSKRPSEEPLSKDSSANGADFHRSKEVTADHHVMGIGFMSLKKRQTPGWGLFGGLKSWGRYYFR